MCNYNICAWGDEYYYFGKEYLTYRKLKTDIKQWDGYVSNKDKLRTIPPYTEHPHLCNVYDIIDGVMTTTQLRHGHDWPCLIQFPEQLLHLPDDALYLVETDLDFFQEFFVKGMMPSLDIFVRTIKSPHVKLHNNAYYETDADMFINEEDLIKLDTSNNTYDYIIASQDVNDNFTIPLALCNLLPVSHTAYYSACFYNKHVAEIYATSVCNFIQSVFDRYITSRFYHKEL